MFAIDRVCLPSKQAFLPSNKYVYHQPCMYIVNHVCLSTVYVYRQPSMFTVNHLCLPSTINRLSMYTINQVCLPHDMPSPFQMIRPIQVKPADSESRTSKCYPFYVLPYSILLLRMGYRHRPDLP